MTLSRSMPLRRGLSLLVLTAVTFTFVHCGGGGSADEAKFALSGKLTSTSVSSLVRNAAGRMERITRTVNYVMAVNPESANPDRRLASVAADGTFSINVVGGRPWVLVFVDSTQTGKNMIVGILKAGTLDTLPVRSTEGSASTGDTTIDGGTGTATSGASLATVLASLGVTADEAEVIGAIDDIAARYANPDIDNNGIIDVSENKTFALDFHMRFDMKTAGGATDIVVDDHVGAYLPTTTEIAYSLGSAYGIWPTSFHSGTYVSGVNLVSGNTFTSSPSSGQTPSSHSQLSYGDNTGFGGDWNSSTEMFGSDGSPVSFIFGFGGNTLTFTNVQTYDLATLGNNANRLMPFFRFVPTNRACTVGCNVASVQWKWMRNTASGWVDATLGDLALVVNDDGGYLSIYRGAQSNGKNISFQIPANSVTGSALWSTAGATGETTLTDGELAALTTDDLCHVGLSYDDKLGMRIFGNIQDGDNNCSR